MKLLPFKRSDAASIGVELEYQIVDAKSFSLASRAKELIRTIKESDYKARITPEITQGMIEINTSIHQSPATLLVELEQLRDFLLVQVEDENFNICGGGTHPFQKWYMQKIFPSSRYKKLANKFRFLSKQATVFGQHIHVGCASADDAIYLTHAFARFVPQFIALSASSPFFQGLDTGFFSSRSTVFNSFPLSGVMPYFLDWREFSSYYYKMRQWGVIESMKDIYWDIRPKPEFGTVEIRVFDAPLTIKRAAIIAAYVQALALYLLEEKPEIISPEQYYLYNYNRFQAGRYGFDGTYFSPFAQQQLIRDDILQTIKNIANYTERLGGSEFIAELKDDVISQYNDAVLLRHSFKQGNTFPKIVAEQCNLWKSPI